ncbi:MAG TPA: polysaccharide biosynthesis/export family protein [Lacipirellulaceae bacterium]|nr:polysaccharide biosynthesis/export family protein [Lacipirellulaceae bacterium]
MFMNWIRRIRFRLSSLLVLVLGVSIGYSLNLHTLQLLTAGPAYPSSPPSYVIEPPDVLTVEFVGRLAVGQSEKHRVGPDGRINLAAYGQVYVAGLTIEQARVAIQNRLLKFIATPHVVVDVFAYNSKNYYVISRGGNSGDTVQKFPITGNETVLDAIAHVGGISPASSARIFISRPLSNGGGHEKRMPVDWQEISRGGSMATNYQLVARDRLIIFQKPATTASN